MTDFDYMHILSREGIHGEEYVVKGYDRFPQNSVLAGQTRINFVDSFNDLEEAQKAYPEATLSHPMIEPVNTYDHLSDEGDY